MGKSTTGQLQAALSTTAGVLAVELDPQTVSRGERPPEALSRDAAAVIAGAVADDLRRIVGDEVAEAGLIVPGALYDLTELLRPGLPLVEALLDTYRGSLRGGGFVTQLLALGAAGGRFPLPEIAPRRDRGAGPLLGLPFALVAPGPQLDTLRTQLETVLLEKGRASLRTDRLVRQQLGVQPLNLSYATFHDLSALLKIQLEHAGFEGLWQLLEAALYRPDEPTVVELEPGNRFLARHGRVWTPFLSFDAWARRFAGEDPVAGYESWLKRQRQYTAGLGAHGIEVRPTQTGAGVFDRDTHSALEVARRDELTDRTVLTETVTGALDFEAAAVVSLTEQATPTVGAFAYTVLAQNAEGALVYLGHDMPLTPEAIAGIRNYWKERSREIGAEFHLQRPGQPVFSGQPPRLMPFLDYAGRTH